MKSNRTGLLLIAGILILPLVLVFLDQKVALNIDREKSLGDHRANVEKILDEAQKFYGNEIQIKILLERMLARVQDILNQEPAERIRDRLKEAYEQAVKGKLPPHDLLVGLGNEKTLASGNNDAEILLSVSNGLGFTQNIDSSYFSRIVIGSAAFSADSTLMTKLTDALHFPGSPESLSLRRIQRFTLQTSWEGNRVWFFQRIGHIGSDPHKAGYLASLVDVEGIPPNFGIETLVREWENPMVGIAFLPLKGQSGYFSKFFENHPSLKKAISGLYKEKFVRKPQQLDDSTLICFGPEILEGTFRPVVIYTWIPVSRTWSFSGMLSIIIFLFILSLFLVEILWLRREVRISVGTFLMGIFLLIAGLPLSGISIFSRFIMLEEEKRADQLAWNKIHSRLKSFDSDIPIQHTYYLQSLRHLVASPTLGEKFFREEKGLEKPEILEKFGSREVMKPVRAGKVYPVLNGIIVLVGLNGYSQSWTRNLSVLKPGETPEDMLQLILPIMRKANERNSLSVGKHDADLGPEPSFTAGDTRDGLHYEMARDFFVNYFGIDSLMMVYHYPLRVQTVEMNLGKVYFLLAPVSYQGTKRYSMVWIWDEGVIHGKQILDFNNEKSSDLSSGSFFVYDKEQDIKIFPNVGLERFDGLNHLLQRARDLRSSLQEKGFIKNYGPMAYEIYYPEHYTSCFFVGAQKVEDVSEKTRGAFYRTIGMGILLAIFLATCSTLFFLYPLRRIMNALRLVLPGKYDARLEDASRHDEFGTLAQAFNSMMKGLQEKEVLGKYVSGSVRRMISEPTFLQAALRGEPRDVTVLFAGLLDFKEFQEHHAPEEVFWVINEVLAALNYAVGLHGGEVSKVIGEKILLTFDHGEFGNGRNAVQSALRVIGTTREALAESPLPPVFGLNSGKVIAGIIGSPTVRRDYTVIGDIVNLAARLETMAHITGGSRTVLSGWSYDLVRDLVIAEKLPFTKVKGKTQAVEAYILK